MLKNIFKKSEFGIKKGYNHRSEYSYFDDTSNTDNWQMEVYQFAKQLAADNGLESVIDMGCGSGYKLIHYLGDHKTIGVDVLETTQWLKEKYPSNTWYSVEEMEQLNVTADLVISADVIEHVLNPDELMASIIKVAKRDIIISTPDRNLIQIDVDKNGPPLNPTHIREWNFEELENYLSRFLRIKKHLITNEEQYTQMIWGEVL